MVLNFHTITKAWNLTSGESKESTKSEDKVVDIQPKKNVQVLGKSSFEEANDSEKIEKVTVW